MHWQTIKGVVLKPKVPLYKNGFILEDGEQIYFAEGSFDKWCVFTKKDGKQEAPKDYDYFQQVYSLSESYGKEKVYSSFNLIYDNVEANDWTVKDRQHCYEICKKVSMDYEEPTLKLWLILYMTMLAEEMKAKKILGKRIKHLGIYNLLFDEYPIMYITGYVDDDGVRVDGYMRNAGGWRKLDELMKERSI